MTRNYLLPNQLLNHASAGALCAHDQKHWFSHWTLRILIGRFSGEARSESYLGSLHSDKLYRRSKLKVNRIVYMFNVAVTLYRVVFSANMGLNKTQKRTKWKLSARNNYSPWPVIYETIYHIISFGKLSSRFI